MERITDEQRYTAVSRHRLKGVFPFPCPWGGATRVGGRGKEVGDEFTKRVVCRTPGHPGGR